MRRQICLTVLIICLLGAFGQHIIPVHAEGEWYAEYFNNATLSGGPTLTRYETNLTFDWGGGSPGEGIPADNFSARLVRDVWFDGGTYHFSYRADDGVRVWVGDSLVIDDWQEGQATWKFIDHYVASGVQRVRIEYFEHGGGAALQIGWDKLNAGETWQGSYFANQNLAGNPVLVRNEAAIDFDWDSGSPDAVVPADGFSARWTRNLGFEAGSYRFYGSCDDGVRIIVDGQPVLDAWKKQQLPNTQHGDIVLGAGQHSVIVEYFEEGGEANAHVWWDRLDTIQGWEGRYYDNNKFRGGPSIIRDDAEINFDWGQGAPANWIPSDDFSVVWTRNINFAPGLYRFNFRTDDGVRLWIDEIELLMNYWEPHDNAWHYRDWHYLEGQHTLKVEYFEEAGNARLQFWWNYAATIESARAMPPSADYGFVTAPSAPAASTPETSKTPAAPATPKPIPQSTSDVDLPGPWVGEYFLGRDMRKEPLVVRNDAQINFNWGWEAPVPELTVNEFAVRWSGDFTFKAGQYTFSTTTDDGVRLYLDDKLLIDSWRPMRGSRQATRNVSAGEHQVRVEYFESSQAAQARVNWVRVEKTSPTPTPIPLQPSPRQTLNGTWDISYYNNSDLSGDPEISLKNQKLPLNFDWGRGSPDEKIESDHFSAVFEDSQHFEAGRYRFTTTSDDGVRLYVDEKLIINSWRPMRGTRYHTLELDEGNHHIRLEYFERSGAAKVTLQSEKL